MPRISALPALVGAVADSDIFPVVQGSITKKVAFSVIRTAFTVGPSSITTTELANNSVSENKLISSPTNDAIRAVTTNHIRDAAITTGKIAVGAITGSLIPDGSISASKLVPASLSITDFNPADAAKLSKTGQVRAGTTVVSSGYVKSIVVVNGGVYTPGSPPTVSISAPPSGGTQAQATAVLTGSAVTSIIVTNQGSGYVTTPTVTFNPGGASAYAYTIINGLVSSPNTGPDASFFITTDEKVKVIGNSSSGQLGTGTASADDITLPQEPNFDSASLSVPTPISIYSGSGSSFVICEDGTVWSCGENAVGQLGLGDLNDRTIFTRIPPSSFNNKPIVKLSVANLGTGVSGTSVLALAADGTVYAWGLNTNGQLGLNSVINQSLPQPVPNTGPGFSSYIITDIAVCGSGTSLVVSALLTSGGQLRTAGYTRYGAMARGPTPAPSSPFVQSNFDFWLNAPLTPVSNIKKVVITSDGSFGPTICALTFSGVVWVAGAGNRGQLGNGTTNNTMPAPGSGFATSPVSSINDIVCPAGYDPCFIGITTATPGAGALRVWGFNSQGQLGIATSNAVTTPQVSGPVGVNFSKVVVSSQGTLFTYALATDNRIFAAGANGNGQLGNATLTATSVASFNRVLLNRSDIVDIAITGVGANATPEVLTSDGKVYKCGNNSAGQLGRGIVSPAITRNWSNVLF